MAKIKFTEEQQQELLKNPFTKSVSADVIKFTDEFNDTFLRMHEQGIGPSEIFQNCGFKISTVGTRRVMNYYNRLNHSSKYGDGKYVVCRSHPCPEELSLDQRKTMPPLQTLSALQTEILYLRQEVEFLKKFLSARR